MNRSKTILKNLDHAKYEHNFDRKALKALKSTLGVDSVGKFIIKHTVERIYTIQYTGSNLKISEESYPHLYEHLKTACRILDIQDIPDFYLQWGYNINGFTTGAENPLIVLNSGVLDLCDEDEILFIIGHECGHIKSAHMLYHMMAQVFNAIIDTVPFGNIAAAPLQYALYYWSRMSEFTADRAGLLCCQNTDAAIRAMMKMSGMPQSHYRLMNYQAFIKQAEEFKMLDFNAMNKAVKLISIMDSTHPWSVMRASELLTWIKSGDYEQILDEHLIDNLFLD